MIFDSLIEILIFDFKTIIFVKTRIWEFKIKYVRFLDIKALDL